MTTSTSQLTERERLIARLLQMEDDQVAEVAAYMKALEIRVGGSVTPSGELEIKVHRKSTGDSEDVPPA